MVLIRLDSLTTEETLQDEVNVTSEEIQQQRNTAMLNGERLTLVQCRLPVTLQQVTLLGLLQPYR